MTSIYGYFNDDNSSMPAYDPGLDVNCPVCNTKLRSPMKTVSLMIPDVDSRSYFYRVHKLCWENLTPEQQGDIDGLLLDPLIQSRQSN